MTTSITSTPVTANIPAIVTQVTQTLAQAQNQPLPPPPTMPFRLRVFSGILVGPRPTLSADAQPVVDLYSSAAGAQQLVGINAGNGQVAAAGKAVSTRPSVRVSDGLGRPVSGVPVSFAVATGSGSIDSRTGPVTTLEATTGLDGVAEAGVWTLSSGAGVNTLTATATDPTGEVGSVSFTALGVKET